MDKMTQIKMILFDLDGTLLPMDQDDFVNGYFRMLAKKVAPLGYEPELLVKAIWKGTAAMVANNGSCTNEEVFWKTFSPIFGKAVYEDREAFDEFYSEEFCAAQKFCGYNPLAAECIHRIKAAGYRIGLATNPLFPRRATEHRICWAGLSPEDFELITTYEDTNSCKPNLKYYEEVLQRIHVPAEACIMIGNDVSEDMVARNLGMKVFLLTDCLINKNEEDIDCYPHGGFEELMSYLQL